MNNYLSASCETFFASQIWIRHNEALHINYAQLIKGNYWKNNWGKIHTSHSVDAITMTNTPITKRKLPTSFHRDFTLNHTHRCKISKLYPRVSNSIAENFRDTKPRPTTPLKPSYNSLRFFFHIYSTTRLLSSQPYYSQRSSTVSAVNNTLANASGETV